MRKNRTDVDMKDWKGMGDGTNKHLYFSSFFFFAVANMVVLLLFMGSLIHAQTLNSPRFV